MMILCSACFIFSSCAAVKHLFTQSRLDVTCACAMGLGYVSLIGLLVVILVGASSMLQGCSEDKGDFLAAHKLKGSYNIMSRKAHGTCVAQPQNPLRWGADYETASDIGCFTRHSSAEFPGTWETTGLAAEIANLSSVENSTITFYDSVTGRPLFEAPKGRSWQDFHRESTVNGWLSFEEDEVITENVRVLPDGEARCVAPFMMVEYFVHLYTCDTDACTGRFTMTHSSLVLC